MKILLLSDASSVHTLKWANSLNAYGNEVLIFSLSSYSKMDYDSNIRIELFTASGKTKAKEDGHISKIIYLKALPKFKKILSSFKPDVLHAHYASSYGLLGALSNFHPYIISVWGSDVFEFPKKNYFYKSILKYNLRKADRILSTSHIMKNEIEMYTFKSITVTPFGVDLKTLKPLKVESIFSTTDIVIGTVKSLEEHYGIEYLIRAFKIVKDKHSELSLKLLIVGGGTLEKKLKKLTIDLNIFDAVTFTGFVDHRSIATFHNMLDVYVALSTRDSESFGVAVLEASACEKPVVVSNKGGLPEVVDDGITGIIVPPQNPEKAADALEKLILSEGLRTKMGKAGRELVVRKYSWERSLELMVDIYQNIIKK